MNILVDRTDRWESISAPALRDSDEIRRYYLALRPQLALLVCRHGLKLGDLQGRVVDAQLGWDRADPGFSREPGTPQTKITIFRIVEARAEERLSNILRRAPSVDEDTVEPVLPRQPTSIAPQIRPGPGRAPARFVRIGTDLRNKPRVFVGRELWYELGHPARLRVERHGMELHLVSTTGSDGYALNVGTGIPRFTASGVRNLLPPDGIYENTVVRRGRIIVTITSDQDEE